MPLSREKGGVNVLEDKERVENKNKRSNVQAG